MAETASDKHDPLEVVTTKEVCSSLTGPRLNIHEPFSLANSRAFLNSSPAASASSTRRRRLPLSGKRPFRFFSFTFSTLEATFIRSW